MIKISFEERSVTQLKPAFQSIYSKLKCGADNMSWIGRLKEQQCKRKKLVLEPFVSISLPAHTHTHNRYTGK